MKLEKLKEDLGRARLMLGGSDSPPQPIPSCWWSCETGCTNGCTTGCKPACDTKCSVGCYSGCSQVQTGK